MEGTGMTLRNIISFKNEELNEIAREECFNAQDTF